jgi:hypothetical protein
MNQSDKIRFTAAMKALAVNASVEITKDTLRLYFEALKDFDISEIETGTHKLLLEWEYNRMPPLSALVKKIQGSQPKIEDRALCEANKILDHLRLHGAGVWPEMSDPITRQLMTTRWHYQTWAAQCVESENHWWVKEFCEAYRSTNAVNPTLEIPDRVRPLLKMMGGER